MGDYKKLEVWNLAKDLAVHIYEVTESGKISKDFGLRDQIRRSAVSVASNIAEGEESGRQLKAINYLYISKGSLAELETQIFIAQKTQYIENKLCDILLENISILSKKLRKLIQYRESII